MNKRKMTDSFKEFEAFEVQGARIFGGKNGTTTGDTNSGENDLPDDCDLDQDTIPPPPPPPV